MATPPKTETKIVLVMEGRDPALEAIERRLEELDLAGQRAGTLQEFQQLTTAAAPAVVITGVSLPDGNWCDVLRSTVRQGVAAKVVVCTREADERLWSEAIWRGVDDILVEPFSTEYLQHLLKQRRGQTGQSRGGDTDRGGDRNIERPSDRSNRPLKFAAASAAA